MTTDTPTNKTKEGYLFPESKRLLEIVESHDWLLFDSTQPEGREDPLTWAEFEANGSVKEFEIGRNYIFAPRPKQQQSLRDAYAVTMGLGPCIRLNSLDEHIDMDGIRGVFINNRLTYFFTRLIFDVYEGRSAVIATSAPTRITPNPPSLIIPSEHVIDKFTKHFEIISPEEYNRWIAVAVPVGPYGGIN